MYYGNGLREKEDEGKKEVVEQEYTWLKLREPRILLRLRILGDQQSEVVISLSQFLRQMRQISNSAHLHCSGAGVIPSFQFLI